MTRQILFFNLTNIFSLVKITCRMTCAQDDFYSFSPTFLQALLAESPCNWPQLTGANRLDVFQYEGLFLPFVSNGSTTLFVVMGARNVSDYSKRTFNGNRPCILVFNPYENAQQRHNSMSLVNTIRHWLNKLWRAQTNGDHFTSPFNHRSMPFCSPFCKL